MAGLKTYPLSISKNTGTALGTFAGVLFLVITLIAYSSKGGTSTYLAIGAIEMIKAGANPTAAALSVRAISTAISTAISMAIPIGALVLGVLSDFIHVRFCLAASLLIFGLGILVFGANPLSPVAASVMGFGQGGLVCLVTVVLAIILGGEL